MTDLSRRPPGTPAGGQFAPTGRPESASTLTEAEARPSRTLWDDDSIQFARLISEISATQDHLDIDALAESMDLAPGDISELFDRADSAWETAKGRLGDSTAPVGGTPGDPADSGRRLEEAVDRYRQAGADIAEISLEHIRDVIRSRYPTARYVGIGWSDQEGCGLSSTADFLDASGAEVTGGTDESLAVDDEICGALSNLTEDCEDVWLPATDNDPATLPAGVASGWYIDLDRVS